MMFKSLLLVGAVLASPLAQAEIKELPSTVCVPAFAALQEPTTEDNLTPYDPFNRYDDIDANLDAGAIPSMDPTTTGMAVIILKEIGKVVGTKIYEAIFKDGTKRTLTKADFDRISEIVKEALREDAKRKMNSCIISVQETAKELSVSWDEYTARDLYSTAASLVDTISTFDHLYSKVALMPSAMLLGSIRASVAQEFLKRDPSLSDKLFASNVKRLLLTTEKYKNEVNTHLLDEKNENVFRKYQSFNRCGNTKVGHAYCLRMMRWYWGKLAVNVDERCEEDRDSCYERWAGLNFIHDHRWYATLEGMREAVYHENPLDEKAPLGILAWEEQLKATPARQQ